MLIWCSCNRAVGKLADVSVRILKLIVHSSEYSAAKQTSQNSDDRLEVQQYRLVNLTILMYGGKLNLQSSKPSLHVPDGDSLAENRTIPRVEKALYSR